MTLKSFQEIPETIKADLAANTIAVQVKNFILHGGRYAEYECLKRANFDRQLGQQAFARLPVAIKQLARR